MNRILYTLFGLICCLIVQAQIKLETPSYLVYFTNQGEISYYINKQEVQPDTIYFRSGKNTGPRFEGVRLSLQKSNKKQVIFNGKKNNILYKIDYHDQKGILCVNISLTNQSQKLFMPENGISLCLGLNTYMDKFPEWNQTYFPTFLRAERTHFNGYFMTPEGKILTIASPDPIASWHYNYEQLTMVMQGKQINECLHRIYSVNLDLLHPLPLPQRHPQNLYALQSGETKTIRLFIKPSAKLEEVNSDLFTLTNAPVLAAKYYTVPVNQDFEGEIWSNELARFEIQTPRNEIDSIHTKVLKGYKKKWNYHPYSGEGMYTVTATDINGKISEMKLYVRPDFDFYLNQARTEALRIRPTSTHHAECFYPLYTYFLARRYQPNAQTDSIAEKVYNQIFPDLFDSESSEMRNGKFRIQDAATMVGVLTDRFQVTQKEEDLKNASLLADFLLRCQKEDGGYYNFVHNTHYTSVIYIAKSIMELMTEEQKLATKSNIWKDRYERHRNSVICALDDLESKGDNIQTEGQMTFEDGMISCSVAQLAYGALRINDSVRAKKYLSRAIELDKKHQCLTQILIPDCRMNGATLRFWEYPYTVNLMHGGMNSPCGWSAWKIYGSWYLYLLTGEHKYMKQVINALGSCLQLVNINTHKLNFSFLPDPYINCYQFNEIPFGSGIPKLQRVCLGEQYIPPISNWHKEPHETWHKKWGIDNFVHEIFKCMTEIFITNAYIHEHDDGSFETINCKTQYEKGTLYIDYAPKEIQHIHINLKQRTKIQICHSNQQFEQPAGTAWLMEQIPEDLSKFSDTMLAPTPPMGWNSFDSYGVYLHEKAAFDNLETMAKRFKSFGYEYFVIDNGWFGEYRLQPNTLYSTERHASDININEYGLLQPSLCYFPNGFEKLIKRCHELGLKFGLHLMRGIPRKAVKTNLPIYGTNFHAADIADTINICKWCHYNYGVDMSKPGSQEFYNSLINQLASWGVDFLKIDDIVPYPKEVEAIVRAVRQCGRKIIISLSPGDKVPTNHLKTFTQAQMLRITGDIWDTQNDIDKCFQAWETWNGKEHPGFWFDMDMIPFGYLQVMSPKTLNEKDISQSALYAGKGYTRHSQLTPEQKRTFITMRALAASPLMIGGDLPTMDDYSFKLLTNRDMIMCNQNGKMGKPIHQDKEIDIWRTDKSPTEGWIGIFNRSNNTQKRNISLHSITLPKNIILKDIWNHTNIIPNNKNEILVNLQAQDVLFIHYIIK